LNTSQPKLRGEKFDDDDDDDDNNNMLIDVAISGDRNVIKKKPIRFYNIKTLQQKYSACGMQKQR